ncbi:hypothetical protein FIBSPDRAFT_463087 [Athelia psychrophila]|uniref:Uncharacterized protein n=1 Tax=Athelia psychrophila TaxID=1759441 RepID=A0A166LNT2_9AGAM|nr:hypothetical protein FIBSPDRAFT_463087 [Fibularhizoctonia sp. CBS 109695]
MPYLRRHQRRNDVPSDLPDRIHPVGFRIRYMLGRQPTRLLRRFLAAAVALHVHAVAAEGLNQRAATRSRIIHSDL